ncbi:MAG: hypothetical protein C4297_05390 [Gemmataceae bacterium]
MSVWVLLKRLSVVTLVALVVLALAYAGWRYEPSFYRTSAVPPGTAREAGSEQFEKILADLINQLQNDADWGAEFTQEQINSWFAEDFVHSNMARQVVGVVSEPRVHLTRDRLRIGFRHGRGWLSSVITLKAAVWICPGEPHAVAVQIHSLRVGLFPLSPKLFQEQFDAMLRQQGMDIQWYRYQGLPTAVIRFQANRREPTFRLRQLELQEGLLRLRGQTLDSNTSSAERPVS